MINHTLLAKGIMIKSKNVLMLPEKTHMKGLTLSKKKIFLQKSIGDRFGPKNFRSKTKSSVKI